MSIARRSHRTGHVLLAVAGSFGVADARELHGLLSELAPDGHVIVDFHDVRVFDDSAIGDLGRELASPYGAHVELRGLSEHQHRLLQYMSR
jgi:anti-anti-sigma regulatory factor